MRVFTYSEARQKLAKLLDLVLKDGEVRIRRRDGQEFVIRPADDYSSPLEVPPVPLDISRDEIVDIIREGRHFPRAEE